MRQNGTPETRRKIMKKISRRNFLKVSGAMAAAGALAACGLPSAVTGQWKKL